MADLELLQRYSRIDDAKRKIYKYSWKYFELSEETTNSSK